MVGKNCRGVLEEMGRVRGEEGPRGVRWSPHPDQSTFALRRVLGPQGRDGAKRKKGEAVGRLCVSGGRGMRSGEGTNFPLEKNVFFLILPANRMRQGDCKSSRMNSQPLGEKKTHRTPRKGGNGCGSRTQNRGGGCYCQGENFEGQWRGIAQSYKIRGHRGLTAAVKVRGEARCGSTKNARCTNLRGLFNMKKATRGEKVHSGLAVGEQTRTTR